MRNFETLPRLTKSLPDLDPPKPGKMRLPGFPYHLTKLTGDHIPLKTKFILRIDITYMEYWCAKQIKKISSTFYGKVVRFCFLIRRCLVNTGLPGFFGPVRMR